MNPHSISDIEPNDITYALVGYLSSFPSCLPDSSDNNIGAVQLLGLE